MTKVITYQILKAHRKLFAKYYTMKLQLLENFEIDFFEPMSEVFKMIYENDKSDIVLKTLRSINFF